MFSEHYSNNFSESAAVLVSKISDDTIIELIQPFWNLCLLYYLLKILYFHFLNYFNSGKCANALMSPSPTDFHFM